MKQGHATVSVEYVNYIMNLAVRFGVEPEKVFVNSGFDPAVLESTGTRIPFEQFNALWKALEESNSDDDLGLHLGEKAFAFPGHIVFLLMLNAPTIKDAIEKFCRYFNLMNDINSPCFSIKGDLVSLSIHFHTTEDNRTRHIYEGILAVYASILHQISENRIPFVGICFVHPRPRNIVEHRRIFNAPLYFDQNENKLVFKKKYLSLPVRFSNKEVLETLERLAQKLQKNLYLFGPWSNRVSRIMMEMLKKEKPEIESIARKLAVSTRNLQRQLKKEGVTYQGLLDRVRKEQAIYFLTKLYIPIGEIAFLLGYSEQSAFNRAFKRWVGSPPGQYRSQFK